MIWTWREHREPRTLTYNPHTTLIMTTRAASKKATAALGRATNPTSLPVVVVAVNEEEAEQQTKVNNDAMEMEFYNRIIHDPKSSAPSPLTSRLVQSKSIQREDAAMNDDDTDEDNGGTTTTTNGEEEEQAQQQAQQPMFAKLSAHAASVDHTTAGKLNTTSINKAEYRRVR